MKASFRYFAGISVTNEKRFVFVMLKYFRVICHTITWMNGKAVRVLQVVHKFRTQQFFKVRLDLTPSNVVHNFASTAGRQSRKLFVVKALQEEVVKNITHLGRAIVLLGISYVMHFIGLDPIIDRQLNVSFVTSRHLPH